MPLSARLLEAVIREMTPPITGGWIQKVFQPSPRTLVFEIRTPGRTHLLLLSADPDTARLHFVDHRPPNPPSPPPFCQYLRAHVQGARIDSVEQVNGDRIARLRLTTRHGPLSLIAELTGRSSNLLLLDADDNILIALDRERVKVGEPYQPPAKPPHTALGSENEAMQLNSTAPFPYSAWLERTYHGREQAAARDRWLQQHRAAIAKQIKKTTRRIEALRGDWEKAQRYECYARYGELLKGQLHAIAKGQDQIVVVDYFDPQLPELVLPLDPAKSAQGNLDDYFKKHRKYVTAARELTPRIADTEAQLAALRAEQAALNRGEVRETSGAAPAAGSHMTRRSASHETEQRRGPFRRFVSTDGCPIYVGRNAGENERLTFGEARPDDLWLHARGVPGSHVVVRLDKGADPPPETLKEAAMLAVLYSDFKKSGKGEVIYTRRKYVRKAKGKPPGTVVVTQEKSVFAAVDRRRLDALKARQAAP